MNPSGDEPSAGSGRRARRRTRVERGRVAGAREARGQRVEQLVPDPRRARIGGRGEALPAMTSQAVSSAGPSRAARYAASGVSLPVASAGAVRITTRPRGIRRPIASVNDPRASAAATVSRMDTAQPSMPRNRHDLPRRAAELVERQRPVGPDRARAPSRAGVEID